MVKRRQTHHQHLGHCPMCGRAYEPGGVEVLRRREGVSIAHAECRKCRSTAILTMVASMLGMITTVGMLTDLARDDIERFWDARAITTDDVLSAHVYLEEV